MRHQYAVLFKTHFWDEFAARRLKALRARCAKADLWVCVDDTHGRVRGIRHRKVFRSCDADMYKLGMPKHPCAGLNWYNVDYPLLAFYHAHPDYKFYVMLEYDAVVNRDLDSMVFEALQRSIDLIAFPSREPVEKWFWSHTLEALWQRDEIRHNLLSICGVSRRAARHLLQARRKLAIRYKKGELAHWPFCEGYVPTTLEQAGFQLESLASFGSTACYEWWPPYHESELPALAEEDFVHPVLAGQRYVSSILRHAPLETCLEPNSKLFHRLSLEPLSVVVPSLLEVFKNDQFGTALQALRLALSRCSDRDLQRALALLLASYEETG